MAEREKGKPAWTKTLTEKERPQFEKWYSGHASKLGLSPDPYDPLHYYDWASAWRAGAKPNAEKHWPSAFKLAGHPNLVVDGMDTRTGKPVTGPALGIVAGAVVGSGDLLARAREAARRELDALRREPERKPRPRLLTGFGRRFQ